MRNTQNHLAWNINSQIICKYNTWLISCLNWYAHKIATIRIRVCLLMKHSPIFIITTILYLKSWNHFTHCKFIHFNFGTNPFTIYTYLMNHFKRKRKISDSCWGLTQKPHASFVVLTCVTPKFPKGLFTNFLSSYVRFFKKIYWIYQSLYR